MPHRLPTLTLAWTVMTLLLGATAADARAQASQIAVVDLRTVLENLDERGEIEAASRRQSQQIEAKRAEMVGEIGRLRENAAMLADGSDQRRAKEDEVVMAQAELEAYLKVQSNRIQRDAAEQIEQMRSKMEAATAAIARERGVQAVFTRSIQVTMMAPNGQPRSVPAPQVVWVADEADITDAVIERMNAEYQRRSDAEAAIGGRHALESATAEPLASSEAGR
jgi:Skp family chaperone for outer membrane proteins